MNAELESEKKRAADLESQLSGASAGLSELTEAHVKLQQELRSTQDACTAQVAHKSNTGFACNAFSRPDFSGVPLCYSAQALRVLRSSWLRRLLRWPTKIGIFARPFKT